jgi:cytoskeletal protein RodZ
MKKLVLSLAIIGFVAFGALGVQNLIAATSQVEIVNFDKDPKKADAKAADTKTVDTKEVKADAKTTESCAKSCSSTCSDKSASAKSCCGSEKSCCTSTTPDKK